MIKIAIIKKMPNGKYRLVSKKKDKSGKRRNLGEFDSLKGAQERERQVQFFKHQHNEDGLMDSFDTKILQDLSNIAISLEERGLDKDAEKIYKCMESFESNCDYLVDQQSAPDRQLNTDNSSYVGGLGIGGGYGLFSIPEGTIASTIVKTIKVATSHKSDKFIKVVTKNGKSIIEAGFTQGSKEVYKKFTNIKDAVKFFKGLKNTQYNLDMVVNSNGLLGTTQLDGQAGGFGGLSDAYFYRNITNIDSIYDPINK